MQLAITAAWAARKSDRVLSVEERSYSGGEVAQRVSDLVRELSGLGVGPRSRLGVLVSSPDDLSVAVLGLFELRAGSLLLSSAFKSREIERYLAEVGVNLLVTDVTGSERLRETSLDVSEVARLTGARGSLQLVRVARGPNDFAPGTPEECLLQFTSGSSGRAKVARRTFDNVTEEVSTYSAATRLGPADRVMTLVPLYHAYGLIDGLLSSAACGATLIIPKRVVPDDLLLAARAERPTLLLAVPFLYELLCAHVGDTGGCMQQARYCFSAGAKASLTTLAEFHSRFGVRINQLYGTSETGVIAFDTLDSGGQPGTVGRPLPGRTVELIDEEGRPCPVGVQGRVRVRGPSVSAGYLNRPDLDGSVFAGGWFHSTDVGKLDEWGNLYLLGRRADFVNVGGLKVDPEEVENTLRSYPGVHDAAVIGERRCNNNEAVVAYVIMDAPVSRQQLLSFCKQRLADYKVPREIRFLSELPRNEMGKLLKKYLYAE